jgi:GNAT superfamily N-acetyltransferase
MNIVKKYLEIDYAYLESFAKRKKTSWGSIFYNEDQPNYYDANHASVSDQIHDTNLVIDEVVEFFESKKIIPRFYLYDAEQNQPLISDLLASQFRVEELIGPIQQWNRQIVSRKQNESVSIEKVTEANIQAALEIECTIKEFGGKEVREKAFLEEFKNPSFIYYLLRYKGEPSSTACIFSDGKQARLESVATLEKYRGKGLIGDLIHHIQVEVERIGYENLWVFPINEAIERVYHKYGFETLGKIKMVHAFRGGKSIQEIREE